MTRPQRYKAEQVIEAIKGTGGIISLIAKKLGCEWHCVQDYIRRYATVKQAYDDEVESLVDLAESIIIRNIQIAAEHQNLRGAPMIVDTADVRFYLSRKGRARGYSSKVEVTGEDGDAIRVVLDV